MSECKHQSVYFLEWNGNAGMVECKECDAYIQVMTVGNWENDES